ncbi:MAG: hypothetical protein ACTS3F_04280 [Phycisphaerales bacterium]
MAQIRGSLTGVGAAAGIEGDFQDMFLILIKEPQEFIASTSPEFGGSAAFPSALWLFKADGRGLLANREPFGGGGATLFSESSDGTGVFLNEPGLYYLAISGASSQPLSGGASAPLPIFQFDAPDEVSGPDGPGGDLPIFDWVVPSETGEFYEIILHGVSFPAPKCPGDLNFDGVVDSDDLSILLSDFGCTVHPCVGDANGDGVTDSDDLGLLLSAFGTKCGPFGACCFDDGACEDGLSIYTCQAIGGVFQGEGSACEAGLCPSGVVSSCCEPQNSPGCDNPVCQAIVCGDDPFCCEVVWDALCAKRATGIDKCGCN